MGLLRTIAAGVLPEEARAVRRRPTRRWGCRWWCRKACGFYRRMWVEIWKSFFLLFKSHNKIKLWGECDESVTSGPDPLIRTGVRVRFRSWSVLSTPRKPASDPPTSDPSTHPTNITSPTPIDRRYPYNPSEHEELLQSSTSFRMSEVYTGLGGRWTAWRLSSHPPRRSGRRDQRGLAATPWRPDVRRGTWRRGLLDRPPGVWGGRPISGRRCGTSRADVERPPTCAVVALGLDGAAEIRRCFPTPSPPHSPPPPLRRPGVEKGWSSLQNFVQAAWTPHAHPSIPLNGPFVADTLKLGIRASAITTLVTAAPKRSKVSQSLKAARSGKAEDTVSAHGEGGDGNGG